MARELIIFTRYPEPGKTKTRLIPLLGEKGASNLHRQMTENTIEQVKPLLECGFLSINICFSGGRQSLMENWLGKEFNYQEQQGGDLGDRLKFAFTGAFDEGKTQVVIVGTDCPNLTENIIQQAFEALTDYDMVLGPACDGGYYLIGLKQVFPELFTQIAWGTDLVFAQTVEIARSLVLKTALLPVLNDIDRPEDLEKYSVTDIGFEPEQSVQ